jgi:hypothetical protein
MTLIPFTEVARRLGIHRTTARIRVASGDIPGGSVVYPRKGLIGARWVVSRAVFETWLKKRNQHGLSAL